MCKIGRQRSVREGPGGSGGKCEAGEKDEGIREGLGGSGSDKERKAEERMDEGEIKDN